MDFQNLREFMDRLTSQKVPGNAVCVYYRGKQVFSYASGLADIENGTPMDCGHLLNIYSCSKVATVTAACQLLERGLILLDEPLYGYIPEYREMTIDTPDCGRVRAKNPITIRDLFCMTAGFTYNLNTPAFDEAYRITGGKMDTAKVIKCMAKTPLAFEPGTKWNYSLCHDVLAVLVEVVSGQKFRDYVRENIFEPLGIRDTFYHHTPEIESRMASQYNYVVKDNVITDPVYGQKNLAGSSGSFEKVSKAVRLYVPGPEYDSGGAGIVTSVCEYAKLAAALAGGGAGANGERILSPATVKLMKTDMLNENTRKTFNWEHMRGYGYGLGVRTLINPAQAGALSPAGEFGWGGAAGATLLADTANGLALFYAHHMLNPQEGYYQPRLRNVLYSCFK